MRFRSQSGWGFLRTLATALIAAMLVAGDVAHAACPSGPDADGDGVCDADDNCMAVANPSQLDTYGPIGSPQGAFGDACDPMATNDELNVYKLRIRRGTALRGKIAVRGDFLLPANEPFAPSDISARVVDGTMLVNVVGPEPLAPVLCQTSSSGKTIKCVQSDPQTSTQMVASFIFTNPDPSVSRVVLFKFIIKKLSLHDLAFMEPLTITLTDDDGRYRWGRIYDCSLRDGTLRCAE